MGITLGFLQFLPFQKDFACRVLWSNSSWLHHKTLQITAENIPPKKDFAIRDISEFFIDILSQRIRNITNCKIPNDNLYANNS
jgi:hypothetical protein